MRVGKIEYIILAFSLILRLGIINYATWYPMSDTRDYHVFAENLLNGQGYQQTYEGESGAYEGLTFYAYRMPGYPVFLATIYSIFGWKQYVAYLANVICDMVSLLCLMLIARHLFDRVVALVAQALFAIHILWTPNLMTEALFTALFMTLTCMLIKEIPTKSKKHALLFALLLMVTLFVRPITLAILPLLFYKLLKLRRVKQGMIVALLILLPSLISLTFWSIRNYTILGEVVVLSTNLGPHNAETFGINKRRTILELREEGMNEAQINQVLIGKIVEVALSSPLTSLQIYLTRILELFSLKPVWELHSLLWERTFTGPNGSELINGLYRLFYFQYYLTYPLALLGAAMLIRKRRSLGGLCWLITSYVLLHSLISKGHIRFAAPLYPFICLFAGYALVQLILSAQANKLQLRAK